jgi:hypothetical protein
MDSLIAGLDLPVVPLSEQQQQELDKQRALQQQLLGLNGYWVCLVLAGVLVAGVTGVWLSTEVFVLDGVITETPDWAS